MGMIIFQPNSNPGARRIPSAEDSEQRAAALAYALEHIQKLQLQKAGDQKISGPE